MKYQANLATQVAPLCSFTCFTVCLSVNVFVCLRLTMFLSVCVFVSLRLCLSASLSVFAFVCLRICLYTSLSVCVFVCLRICLHASFRKYLASVCVSFFFVLRFFFVRLFCST